MSRRAGWLIACATWWPSRCRWKTAAAPVADFVASAKANPREANFGSPAAGSVPPSGAARNRFAPTVATDAEQGFKDIVFDAWFGFFVPAKTPAEVVAKLSAAIRGALTAPEVVDALALMGLEAKPSSPAELAALLQKDSERWAPLIKTIGFSAES